MRDTVLEHREFGKVGIGKGCIIDEGVAIGYPPRDILEKKGFRHSLVTRIGSRCIIRTGCVIYATARMEDDVQLGHHVVIRERAKIGRGSKVGSFTEIAPDAKLGRECRIVGLAHVANKTEMGDRVFVGPGLMTANRRFADSFHDGREDLLPMEPPSVGDDVLIGAQVTLNPGVRIGRGAIVAAGCVVTKDIPAGAILAGVPGRVIGSVDKRFRRGAR